MSMDRFTNPFQQAVMDRFDAMTKSDAAFQLSVQRKLDNLTTLVSNIKVQGDKQMAMSQAELALLDKLNNATNGIAAKLTELAAEHDDDPELNAALSALATRLEGLAADPVNPVPPVDPPPAEPTEL